MPTKLADIKDRQHRVMRMIRSGACTISCAGAIHTSTCHCICGGLNHGALWFDEIASEYDKAVH